MRATARRELIDHGGDAVDAAESRTIGPGDVLPVEQEPRERVGRDGRDLGATRGQRRPPDLREHVAVAPLACVTGRPAGKVGAEVALDDATLRGQSREGVAHDGRRQTE